MVRFRKASRLRTDLPPPHPARRHPQPATRAMSEKGKVLILGDANSPCAGFRRALESGGYGTATADTCERALERVGREAFDAVLLLGSARETVPSDTLRRLRQASPHAAVFVVSRNPSIRSAIQCIKLGAYDYLPEPAAPGALLKHIGQAVQASRRDLEDACIGGELERQMLSHALIGRSEAMGRVVRLVRKAALADSPVLVTGETGTGKELVARAIHRLGRRSQKPFVAADCRTPGERLLERELFGRVEGGFPGTVADTPGKIALAHGGTLFLDAIAGLGVPAQAQLLHVLREREIPAAAGAFAKVDVRFISSTDRDLREAVREGRFREDLYYRLNVLHIPVPPLRERPEDIPVLAEYYLKKLAAEKTKPPVALSDRAMQYLKRCEWPGNVRELVNALEYAVVTCDGKTIGLRDLPHGLEDPSGRHAFAGGSLARMERNEILSALDRFQGNKTRAAGFLGINRKTLREKIRKYDIFPEGR